MLFKQKVLDAIAAGQVSVAFRRWKRPTVKAGGRLRTPVGELAILSMDRIEEERISELDARAAGFPGRSAVLKDLRRWNEGHLYRIRFRLLGPDTRIALREDARLTREELKRLQLRLAALDSRSTAGPWTRRVLEAIREHPELPAADLAAGLGLEKEWIKTHVRKLKNLGLTESLSPGYRISPRGRVVLAAMDRGGEKKSRRR
jgi:hypothetical protein